ncbi:hypothetical protein TEA_004804 [Camellia sinensis var. sinensis]|uniref:Uncharacterized protein n=1 Tax=Camellia sinensis var. sinensis TaxID=542762 RepID=A0A4S4DHB0_CAMSN|nr:hypothetical protein TEA_004804 [Camellia sinensis var. sinensis]
MSLYYCTQVYYCHSLKVVVFDNNSSSVNGSSVTTVHDNSDDNESGAAFLIRILQYLETPQYLRKSLFPKHNTLRFVGLLPPLDAPHHLRKHEWAPYREGVTLKEQAPNFASTLVDVGLSKNVLIDTVIEPGVRVTVAMGTNRNLDADLPRQVVSSSQPREELGMYWGYKVRHASSISSVFNDSPYKGGYDHLIGTSEHGLFSKSSELTVPSFRSVPIRNRRANPEPIRVLRIFNSSIRNRTADLKNQSKPIGLDWTGSDYGFYRFLAQPYVFWSTFSHFVSKRDYQPLFDEQ